MKRRVLIVEDEAIVADDLQHQILQLGYDVIGLTDSGAEAIALSDEKRPDIVLMDIQLQGPMSGTEAAKIIQENTGAGVVFVTAFAAIFVRDPSQMTSPGICLSKPFSPLQLKTALVAATSDASDANSE